jgi:hypothetical protein
MALRIIWVLGRSEATNGGGDVTDADLKGFRRKGRLVSFSATYWASLVRSDTFEDEYPIVFDAFNGPLNEGEET